jgi:hypothetical protein
MIHDDLLDIADELARRDLGRPKQSSLRRAVSSAYYAIFHALAFMCTSSLIGWNKPWDVTTQLYRALDHAAARKLFERDRQGVVYGREAASFGRIFIELQQARVIADYDPSPFNLNRQATQELIDRAREAARSMQTISAEKRLLIAVHLIARPR